MKVFCPGLLSGKYIATKYAHKGVQGGQNISPQISWGDVPNGTKSFVLSIIDRHPIARNWVHWYVINIPSSTREIAEKASGMREKMPAGSLELRNTFGDIGYGGPKPPKSSGAHDYVITVYAVNVESLPLGPFSTIEECTKELEGKVLASANTVGIFQQ